MGHWLLEEGIGVAKTEKEVAIAIERRLPRK
jgi:hypothetical protein